MWPGSVGAVDNLRPEAAEIRALLIAQLSAALVAAWRREHEAAASEAAGQ